MALLQRTRGICVGRSAAAPLIVVRQNPLSSSNRLRLPLAAAQGAAWVTAAAGIDAPAAAESGTTAAAKKPAPSTSTEEGAALTPGRGSSQHSTSSSTSRGEGDGVVRISAGSVPAKVAGYMIAQFEERGPDYTVCLMAVGSNANMVLLKALARLQDTILETQPEKCVVFQPQAFRVQLAGGPGAQGGSEGPDSSDPPTGDSSRRGIKVFVTLGSRTQWPSIAFDPNSGMKLTQDQEADAAPQEDSSSSSSSMGGVHWTSGRGTPMLVRPSNKEAGEAVQRMISHALRTAERQLPAQFVVAGNLAAATARAPLLFSAVSGARKSAFLEDKPYDLQCTLVKTTYSVSRQQRTDVTDAAGAAEEPDAAAEGDSAGAAAGEDGPPVVSTRVRYLITVQPCEPRRRPQRASRTSSKTRDRDRSAPSRSGARSSSRPGYIEVKVEEWNQLKEQLQVVPHLTEQLQIMTRQHEQLLSLLAVQQETQQQGATEPKA